MPEEDASRVAGHGRVGGKGELERAAEKRVPGPERFPLPELLEEHGLGEGIARLLQMSRDPTVEESKLALLVAVQPEVSPHVHAREVDVGHGEVSDEIAPHARRPGDWIIAGARGGRGAVKSLRAHRQHVVRVDGLGVGGHLFDPSLKHVARVVALVPGLVDELPREDGGVVAVRRARHGVDAGEKMGDETLEPRTTQVGGEEIFAAVYVTAVGGTLSGGVGPLDVGDGPACVAGG